MALGLVHLVGRCAAAPRPTSGEAGLRPSGQEKRRDRLVRQQELGLSPAGPVGVRREP